MRLSIYVEGAARSVGSKLFRAFIVIGGGRRRVRVSNEQRLDSLFGFALTSPPRTRSDPVHAVLVSRNRQEF